MTDSVEMPNIVNDETLGTVKDTTMDYYNKGKDWVSSFGLVKLLSWVVVVVIVYYVVQYLRHSINMMDSVSLSLNPLSYLDVE